MPRVEIAVKTKDGQTIVLSPEDRLEKTVTIECNSSRCASRHGQDKPLEVSIVEGEPMPEAGEQWLSLILPEKSPQYTPMPPNFCGPQCARDFLVYDYIAPQHKSTENEQKQAIENIARQSEALGEYDKFVEPESQADGCADPADCHGA